MSQRFYEVKFTAGMGNETTYQEATFRQYCATKEQQVAEQTAVLEAVKKAIEETVASFK